MDELALQGLASLVLVADAEAQARAAQFVEQLKQSADGWKICAQGFTCGSYHQNDHVKFFCLQVCEYYARSGYLAANPENVATMKSFLLTCLEMESNVATQSKTFIRNKLAQLVSLVFITDFQHRWPLFFTDILSTLSRGPLAVDMYLRILMAIDAEVVDRDIAHTQEEAQRNSMIKDAMRERCVNALADSWYQVMTTYDTTQPDVVSLCLEVTGRYVSWMDIGYFANDRMVELLLKFLKVENLRESACDCVHEIISKGMEPVAKTSLIESFMTVLDSAGIFKTEDDDCEFLCKLSKLINGVGLGLIASWQKLSKNGMCKNSEATMRALESKIPYMLRYLGDEDDDVSDYVIEFATEYIALVKSLPSMSQIHKKHIEGLLFTIIKKMKYDSGYNFEKEGEEEAEFQEYRKQVRVIFNNIASLDTQMILIQVHELVSQTLPRWESLDFRDVEIAITLLYSLGEALPAAHGQHFSGNPEKASALQNMMRILITSQVSRKGHIAVLLQFFETVVRYDRFFVCESQHIPPVLMAFLDERGLRHPSAKVRSRVAYLFLRFVKSTKTHLTPYLEDVLKQMQDLLQVHSPDNGLIHSLSDSDQLFIYETASTLIVSSSVEPEKKQALMKQLLLPIATKFNIMLSRLTEERDEKRQQEYAECIHNAIALASRASKGFSGQQTMKQCGCVTAFTELLSIFLAALEVTNQRASLHQGVRQYLHRMVVCLEEEIMPFLPEAMERLLKQPDARELYDFLPLVNQVIMKFKANITPFLTQVFMPLVVTIYQVLNTPVDLNDHCSAEEKKLLQRGYFLLLATIVCNCIDVLKAQDMQNLNQVLMSLIQGAVDLPDPQSQKCCFSTLKKLIELWGGKEALPGFPEFIYKEIVPACFMAPMKPTFDLADGQTTLVLGESALCMQEILQQRGVEFLEFLKSDFFPSKGISAESGECYLVNLQTGIKPYRTWLKKFFMQAKS
ncbi:exportin-T-like [Biomphalaria glabrata]|uniref:Exportin-T n=1 Tax=Biomphalaria glabrata TaxID=6526 RepID=A0A9U8EBF8_BIOGL|nr:exportin-T-like [Biomphalaria glabrata]XP_013079974.2 exportin-T-like [Biomphalaria glabrata]